MHHGAEGDGVDGVEGAIRAAPTASPFLSLQFIDLNCVYRVSPPPVTRTHGGPFYSRF
jgi:hypothetical protein